jgi:ectoine hydroxylase-related dioxygenase (phytanoyl-CoA dioxygenase family)
MISVPTVHPGDMVFWQCDVVHAVEKEHTRKRRFVRHVHPSGTFLSPEYGVRAETGSSLRKGLPTA